MDSTRIKEPRPGLRCGVLDQQQAFGGRVAGLSQVNHPLIDRGNVRSCPSQFRRAAFSRGTENQT
jgi:hypothetical protein